MGETVCFVDLLVCRSKNCSNRSCLSENPIRPIFQFMLIFIDPYVSVSLFREQSIERKDTAKKTNTRDPEYNESIEFDISTDVTKPLTTYTLVVTINHSSLIGTDCVLGHVIFSLTSPQRSACEQWKHVEQSPHQHGTEWHSLIDPDEL